MMKLSYKLLLCALLFVGLSGAACGEKDPVKKPDTEEPDPDPNPGGDIDYSKVGAEYNDGKNIVFNVKIGIDKEGWEARSPEFFKSRLKTQWEEINERFNKADTKDALERNYIFVPDLDDIIVLDMATLDGKGVVPGTGDYNTWTCASYAIKEGEVDKKRFQIMVTYDFIIHEGAGGGGCSFVDDRVSSVLVINPGQNWVGKFYDHFDTAVAPNTAAAITHELGHARGLIDIYNHPVSAGNNPVSGQAYIPEEHGIMYDKCYGTIEQCTWSDYEMQVINLTQEKILPGFISKVMSDYFADYLELTVTENGQPVSGYTLNFYKTEYSGGRKVMPSAYKTHTVDGNKIRLDAKQPLFWMGWDPAKYAWMHHPVFLIEVISKDTGKKAYSFLSDFHMHSQGIKDKRGNLTKTSILKRTIDIE